ncbi:hypothetical protein IWQ62_004883 [Dispira parvispora]|uniref:RING-type domain-containing protein n=1 Tax=Dispira parvispora TaxID=1520584 RepID=A0A9W8AN81_9FUNG|nr:hypothetical protein IWQ62_004883 [Dispira parvispora]
MSIRTYVFITALLSTLVVSRFLELLRESPQDNIQHSNFYQSQPDHHGLPITTDTIHNRLSFKQTQLFPYTQDSWFWRSVHLLALLFTTSKLHFAICLNTLFCLLTIMGSVIEFIFFDRLRSQELQHMYEHTLNFFLFKLFFITLAVQPEWEELVVWILLYIFFGCLSIFTLVCRDRHEMLLAAAEYKVTDHIRIAVLLALICLLDTSILLMCFLTLQDLFVFISFEPTIILIDTLHTLIRYVGNLGEISGFSNSELYSDILTYIDFAADVLVILVSMAYYLHILTICGLSFNPMILVVLLNLRGAIVSLRRKIRYFIRRRENETRLGRKVRDATPAELASLEDSCVICREPMYSAKRMSCGHFFHRACLRSWIRYHPTCPICRVPLKAPSLTMESCGQQPSSTTSASISSI